MHGFRRDEKRTGIGSRGRRSGMRSLLGGAVALLLAVMGLAVAPVSPAAHAAPEVIFADDFESGDLTAWSTSDHWQAVTGQAGNPGYSAMGMWSILGGNVLQGAHPTTGHSGIELEFSYALPVEEAGYSLMVHWYSGFTWHEIATFSTATAGWQTVSFALPAAAADNASFILRFATITPGYSPTSAFAAGVDDVVLSGEPIPVDTAPPTVTAWAPTMGATIPQGASTDFTATIADDLTPPEQLTVDYIFSAGAASYTYPRHSIARSGDTASRSIAGWQIAEQLGLSLGDTFDWTIAVTDLAGNTRYHDVTGLVFSPSAGLPPDIETAELPPATTGSPYLAELESTGIGPFTWTSDVPMPAGLTLDAATGTITGTATTPGVTNISFTVTNAAGSTSSILPLWVQTAPQIVTEQLADGAVGSNYTRPISVSGTGPFTWTIVSGALPDGVALTPTLGGGALSGPPTEHGTFTFEVEVSNRVGSDTRTFTLLVSENLVPPSIITVAGDVPPATVGEPYFFQFEVEGTDPAFQLLGASLPAGLEFDDAQAIISGVPEPGTEGDYPLTLFAVRLADDDLLNFTLQVLEPAAVAVPAITTASPLPDATAWAPYSQTLAATGDAPITWSAAPGALPAWLDLDPASGELSGLPDAAGTWTFDITATNAGGSDTRSFTVTAGAHPVITAVSLPGGVVGTPYSETLVASGTAPIDWSLGSGTLPPCLLFAEGASGGAFSGTPSEAGSWTFEITVDNAHGTTSREYTIVVTAAPEAPVISTTSLPDATAGTPYSQALATSAGTGPLTWTASSTLPDGLSLTSAGVLQGTPIAAGPATFDVEVTGPGGSDTATVSLTVLAAPIAPEVTTSSLPDGTVGVPYSQTLAATGTGPLVWATIVTPPPAWLTLASDGTVSGTPTAAGPVVLEVEVVGPGGADTHTFTFTIDDAPVAPVAPVIGSDPDLPAATVGTPYSEVLVTSAGTGPFAWTLISGALPDGLTLGSDGTIAGSPLTAGSTSFVVEVTGPGGSTQATLTLLVQAADEEPGGPGEPEEPGPGEPGEPGQPNEPSPNDPPSAPAPPRKVQAAAPGIGPDGQLPGIATLLLMLGAAVVLARRRSAAQR